MTAARPVEPSLFPDVAPDRPRGHLVGSVISGTNADLIAAIAPIYLHGRSVLDATYGRGGWWRRYQPDQFAYHDLAVDGVDFRYLPETDSSVDVVCFDPPYIPAGGGPSNKSADDFRDRFGLEWGDGYRNQDELLALFRDGIRECARVASQWVLAKCSDYVSSGRFRLGHLDMIDAARDAGLGTTWDLIVHHTGAGPGGHNIFNPRRARRHHSYLLVFKVPS